MKSLLPQDCQRLLIYWRKTVVRFPATHLVMASRAFTYLKEGARRVPMPFRRPVHNENLDIVQKAIPLARRRSQRRKGFM